jgi:hypothetical protein
MLLRSGFGHTLTTKRKKLGDPEEFKRRTNLEALLAEVILKMDKPKEELHKTLDEIELAIVDRYSKNLIINAIKKVRNLPKNKRS